MIGLLPILARWRLGLGIAGALAVFGLFAASWHYRNAYHAEIARRKAQEAQYIAAQVIAMQKAQAALAAVEAQYRSKADEADQSYRVELADARSAADRYIATHRVRGTFASPSSGPTATAEDRAAGVLPPVPDAALVAVTDRDVQACTDAYIYAVKARDWALTLTK